MTRKKHRNNYYCNAHCSLSNSIPLYLISYYQTFILSTQMNLHYPNIVLLGSMMWNINTKDSANINPHFVNYKIFNGHFQAAAVIVRLNAQ